jgi:hypothetical protein
MADRREDWRDLLSAYSLALKGNKIWTAFKALLFALLVMFVASFAYAVFSEWGLVRDPAPSVRALGRIWGARAGGAPYAEGSLVGLILSGRILPAFLGFAPLLNPFCGADLMHALLCLCTYVALFAVMSGPGGTICRLTALEYARDDFPTLADATAMVRGRRNDYFLALLFPLLFVLAPVAAMAVVGLIASLPALGGIWMLVVYPVSLLLGAIAWLFAVGWLLSFGLITPAISVSGKDAFDGWSTSYAYVLWQFGRYLCYTVLAAVIGVVSLTVGAFLVNLLLYIVHQSVEVGFVSSKPWLAFSFGSEPGSLAVGGTLGGSVLWFVDHAFGGSVTVSPGWFSSSIGNLLRIMAAAVKLVPFAYFVSYFFTANTLVFFLLRKHVDNIGVEDVYEEEEEEEEPEVEPAGGEGVARPEEPVLEAEPTGEQAVGAVATAEQAVEAPPTGEEAGEADAGAAGPGETGPEATPSGEPVEPGTQEKHATDEPEAAEED